jgi:DNA methylase
MSLQRETFRAKEGAVSAAARVQPSASGLVQELERFEEFGALSLRQETSGPDGPVPTFVNEFWTSRQRQAHSLHEVSYRACFKPQLPAFFVERLTRPGGVVYDPFMGRGTTPLETALRGRAPWGNDLNPLSQVLLRPRLEPPTLEEVRERLATIDLDHAPDGLELFEPPTEDLLAFFHPETLTALRALRAYLLERESANTLDHVDRWIRMVAVNRLTGHSPGFFSVYTLPPNQAVTATAQRAINARREQTPPVREIRERILRKTRALLRGLDAQERQTLRAVAPEARLLARPAHDTPQLPARSVDLVVTSPPFLDVVDYAADNWLRCWFCGLVPGGLELTVPRGVEDWQGAMTAVFHELVRVVRPGGCVAFEVGEVRGGTVLLEEKVLPCAVEAGLRPLLVMINQQEFTKTANCWGVTNQRKGTNTNRICVLVKD